MPDTIKWKGEIEFEGPVEQFRELAKLLETTRVKVTVGDLGKRPGWLSGYPRLLVTEFLKPERMDQLIKDRRMTLVDAIHGIPGGIRVPHVHIRDRVALFGREEFKLYAGELAKTLAEKRVSEIDDLDVAMKLIDELAVPK